MPAAYRIDASDGVVYSRAWGVLTDADISVNRTALTNDPLFTPRSSQLYDFSEVTALEVTASALRELARTSPFDLDARRAIVVPSDVAYGMARMYGLLSGREDSVFRIFRERAEAIAWLRSAPSAAASKPPPSEREP